MTALLSEQAGKLDITLEEGTDFQTTLTWKDSNDQPIDLTGFSAKMQIRKTAGLTGTPELELTDAAGLTLGGALGTIIVNITAVQNIFGSKSFVYDLILTDGAGTITPLLRGTITSIAKVTI
jgi:hypothetical protein